MKFKKSIMLLLLLVSFTTVVGCSQEEDTLYNRDIVIDGASFPFYESSLTYNAENQQSIANKLYVIFAEGPVPPQLQTEYVILNHDGENLTDTFTQVESPSYGDLLDMAKQIKENGYLVVDKKYYRISTLEKEIKALFDGERLVWPEKLDKILEDNKEAYRNKDYETIHLYLMKNRIMVWKQMAFEEDIAP